MSYCNTKEAAHILNVDRSTIWRWIQAGKLITKKKIQK
ncbi:helix-turn-helix domain-containing protein [Patescibacteria group bacterium]|nr:helix-turn-helix domain-containing protein [Patescibacteria group bacterium]